MAPHKISTFGVLRDFNVLLITCFLLNLHQLVNAFIHCFHPLLLLLIYTVYVKLYRFFFLIIISLKFIFILLISFSLKLHRCSHIPLLVFSECLTSTTPHLTHISYVTVRRITCITQT